MSNNTTTAKPTILAVDPGKKQCGVAYFAGTDLICCALVKAPREHSDTYETALAVAEWFFDRIDPTSPPDLLVVEHQQIYGGIRSQNPNDLLPLAQVVGGIFARIPHRRRVNPLPRVWKGTTPKEIFSERLRAGLSENERRLLSDLKMAKSTEHNVLDAIGLGKWGLEWLNRRP